MDALIVWVKKNQLLAGAIALIIVSVGYSQLSQPRNYEDCLLKVVKQAKSDKSAIIGRQACRKKFPVKLFGVPAKNPFLSQPQN